MRSASCRSSTNLAPRRSRRGARLRASLRFDSVRRYSAPLDSARRASPPLTALLLSATWLPFSRFCSVRRHATSTELQTHRAAPSRIPTFRIAIRLGAAPIGSPLIPATQRQPNYRHAAPRRDSLPLFSVRFNVAQLDSASLRSQTLRRRSAQLVVSPFSSLHRHSASTELQTNASRRCAPCRSSHRLHAARLHSSLLVSTRRNDYRITDQRCSAQCSAASCSSAHRCFSLHDSSLFDSARRRAAFLISNPLDAIRRDFTHCNVNRITDPASRGSSHLDSYRLGVTRLSSLRLRAHLRSAFQIISTLRRSHRLNAASTELQTHRLAAQRGILHRYSVRCTASFLDVVSCSALPFPLSRPRCDSTTTELRHRRDATTFAKSPRVSACLSARHLAATQLCTSRRNTTPCRSIRLGSALCFSF